PDRDRSGRRTSQHHLPHGGAHSADASADARMTAGSVGITNPIKAGHVEGPREETSLVAFLSILLANRKLIAICTLIGTLIFGAIAATTADLYVSHASFIVKNTRTPVQIPGGA